MIFNIKDGPRVDQLSSALFARKEERQIVTFQAAEIERGRKTPIIEIRLSVNSIQRENIWGNWIIKGTAIIDQVTHNITCTYKTFPVGGRIITL